MLEAPLASHRLRMRVLGIDSEEASFARRGFTAVDTAVRARLELVGRTFVFGYRAGLTEEAPGQLERTLGSVDAEIRGFAYEGAAMALTMLDELGLRRRLRRLAGFMAGPASAHVYMAHVGAGWALARLRRGPGAVQGLDPLLRWLALDGYGFHQGYFAPTRHLVERRVPRRFSGYALRAFDQGLGRSVWFTTGADPDRAAQAIGRFAPTRRPDLWSGVALAAAYAGPISSESLGRLRGAVGAPAAHLAQGAAFAAAARARAGNPAAHTELACQLLTGRSARDAAEETFAARLDLPPDGDEPAYEVWRSRLRHALGESPSQANPRAKGRA